MLLYLGRDSPRESGTQRRRLLAIALSGPLGELNPIAAVEVD